MDEHIIPYNAFGGLLSRRQLLLQGMMKVSEKRSHSTREVAKEALQGISIMACVSNG